MEAGDEAILKSLRHSKIRIVVLLFIFHSFYRQANLKELCKGLNVCASNILGSLNGNEGRYKAEYSLVCLGLLERVETDLGGYRLVYYRLTEKGVRIAGILEKEPTISIILGKFNIKRGSTSV